MKILNRRNLLIVVVVAVGIWLIADFIYAGLVVQRVMEISRELKARHGELVEMWGWEKIIEGGKK